MLVGRYLPLVPIVPIIIIYVKFLQIAENDIRNRLFLFYGLLDFVVKHILFLETVLFNSRKTTYLCYIDCFVIAFSFPKVKTNKIISSCVIYVTDRRIYALVMFFHVDIM